MNAYERDKKRLAEMVSERLRIRLRQAELEREEKHLELKRAVKALCFGVVTGADHRTVTKAFAVVDAALVADGEAEAILRQRQIAAGVWA